MHIPVLIKEVLENLDPKPGKRFIDATLGEGGHAKEILEKTKPNGTLLGIDVDEKQIERSRANLAGVKERVVLVNDSYKNISEIAKENGFQRVDGIIVDLGFSSQHVEDQGRGFSFQKDEVLDMRYSKKNTLTAKDVVNTYSESELETIFEELGEERFSKQIAKNIIVSRKKKAIESTFELRDIILSAIPSRLHHQKIHPATRVFQAIRIAVNGELENLKVFLPNAVDVLQSNGRLVVISFQSLEDRIVKNFFKEQEKKNNVKILTKKPITASLEEIKTNPRARSAKLRAIEKLS